MEDLLRAKETLEWLHTQHCHTQANAHHQELHGSEPREASSKRIFVAQQAQPCLQSLAKCERSIHF